MATGSPLEAQGTDLFTSAVHEVLDYLTSKTAIHSWSVSRIAHGEQVHLHAEGGDMLSVGQRVAWNETFCKRMLAGAAQLVPDATLDPDYSDHADVPAIRAYASAPLTGTDGELFGTLCGVSDQPLANPGEVDSDLVQMLGRLLSSQLSVARQLDLAVERESRATTSAETDALTGVLNRRGWDAQVAHVQQRITAYGDVVAVVVVDLDGLKQVNDTRGHEAGDELIQRAAQVLRSHVRRDDQVARFGGDEFAVLLNEVSEEMLPGRLQELGDTLAAAGINASLGGAVTAASSVDLAAAFRQADAEMYRRKAAGRQA